MDDSSVANSEKFNATIRFAIGGNLMKQVQGTRSAYVPALKYTQVSAS